MDYYINSEFLCNLMYKHLLDIQNNDPSRKTIINIFEKQFEMARLTSYNDIVAITEIESEAVFISQVGVFRYKNLPECKYVSLADYKSQEYYSMGIVYDIYDDGLENSSIPSCNNFKLEYLVCFDDASSYPAIKDDTLSELYLEQLLEKMSLYLSTIKVIHKSFGYIL